MSAGVAVAVAAAACFELAYVLQALEARVTDARHALRPTLLGRLARRPRWLAGTALSGAGAALQVLALSLAPLSVVQPTLALGLVLLLVLARVVLHETVGRRELLGVLAIVAGVSAVMVAAPPTANRAGAGAALLALLGVLAALAAAPYALRGRSADPRPAVAGAAAGDALAALTLKLVADDLGAGRPLAALAWAGAALAAGFAALTAEMSALQLLPASRVAPVVLAAQVLVPVAVAPALLGESWGSTPLGGVLLLAGVAVTAAGAALLGASAPVGGLIAAAHGHGVGEVQHQGGGGGESRE